MDGFLTPLLSPLDCMSGSEKREQYRSELLLVMCIKIELIFYLLPRERLVQLCPKSTSLHCIILGDFHLNYDISFKKPV